MKYIFLIGSIFFGITGICQAMGEFMNESTALVEKTPVMFNLQFFRLTFHPAPGFVSILVLSIGLFALFLTWQKIKQMGLNSLLEYVP